MKHYIDSYDIKKHHKILSESANSAFTDKSELLYRLSEEKKNTDTDIAFFNECAKNSANANLWLESCLDILESRPNDKLKGIFENNILPLTGLQYVSKALHKFEGYSESINTLLQNYYNLTLAKEQVYNFHEAVMKFDTKLEESVKDKLEFYNLVNRCCYDIDSISGIDYPVANKIIASVNETLYNLQIAGYDTKVYELSVVSEVMNYYGAINDSNNSMKETFSIAIKGLSKDPMLVNYYDEGFTPIKNLSADLEKQTQSSSSIVKACSLYMNDSPITIQDLVAVKNTVLNSDDYDIIHNFGAFMVLLEKIIFNANERYTLSQYIVETLVLNLYKDIYENIIVKRLKARTIITSLIATLGESINRLDEVLKTPGYDVNFTTIIKFKNQIELLQAQLKDSLDFIYTDYAAECATIDIVKESSDIKSLNDFKVFKFDNLVTRCYKLDKYLQTKFNQFKEKFKVSIKRTADKIFEESSVYDMIDEDGNLDYCIASYDISNIGDFSGYHEFCTQLIKEMNKECTEGTVYYQVNPDTLEFRIRDNLHLTLTTEEVDAIEHSMSVEDMNRMKLVTMGSQLYREDYNYIEESKEFFKKNYDKEIFETYLEACSLAGVPKETVHDIYVSLVDYHGSSFSIENCYLMGEYQPVNADIEVAMEAAGVIEYMLEADKPLTDRQKANRERMNAKLAQWEKEEEEKDNKKSSSNTTNTNINQKEDTKKKDTSDKGGKGTLVKIANRLKLYLHAIRGFAKKADAKTQTAIRNMDASVSRFFKGVKNALVSDRREAIIKGSVIPSFHKCILIAVTFAGVAYFNLPLAVIGSVAGLAASKNLTKKERALLYDDIMIELRIVQKEIQRAEEKNQIKKMRELMRMQKELERQAARIQFNIRIGKDFIPGGRYVNQDNEY